MKQEASFILPVGGEDKHIIFGDNHILSFFSQHDGQAKVALARDRATDSLVALKLYGLGGLRRVSEEEAVFAREPNPLWKRIYENEKRIARKVGELFPHFPILYDHGEHDGVFWTRSSFSRRTVTDRLDGFGYGTAVVGLEDVITGRRSGDAERDRHVSRMRDWRSRARLFSQMLRMHDALERAGIVHNDVKPSQYVVLCTEEGDILQGLDFGMAFTIDGSHRDAPFFATALTTPLYSSPDKLELVRRRRQEAIPDDEVSEDMRRDPQRYHAFDRWGLGLVGAELFGRNPLHALLDLPETVTETATLRAVTQPGLLDRSLRMMMDAHGRLETLLQDPAYSLRDQAEGVPRRAEGAVRALLGGGRLSEAEDLLAPYVDRRTMRRRRFLQVLGAASAAVCLGIPVYHVRSAEHRRKQLLEDYEQTGSIDADLFDSFVTRVIDEKLRAPLLERAEFARENGRRVLKRVPQFVTNGEYVNDMLTLIGAGDFFHAQLLCGELTEDDRYIDSFEQSFQSLPPQDFSDDVGYRLTRFNFLGDLLVRHADIENATGHRFSVDTLTASRQIVDEYLLAVIDKHIEGASPIPYLKASPSDAPKNGSPFLLRADAARIALAVPDLLAHSSLSSDQKSELRRSLAGHIELSSHLVRTSGLTYDRISFSEDEPIEFEAYPGNGTLVDGEFFGSYSVSHLLLCDLLQGTENRQKMIAMFRRNQSELNYSPHMLFNPPSHSEKNNYALAMHAASVPEDNTIADLIRSIDLMSSEGLLPESRRGYGVPPSIYIESDRAVLSAFRKWKKK